MRRLTGLPKRPLSGQPLAQTDHDGAVVGTDPISVLQVILHGSTARPWLLI